MANAPLSERDGDNTQVIWVKREAKYFCKRSWTQHRVICPSTKSTWWFPQAQRHPEVRALSCAPRRMAASAARNHILRDAAKTPLLRMTVKLLLTTRKIVRRPSIVALPNIQLEWHAPGIA
jgi:hypothetical protein